METDETANKFIEMYILYMKKSLTCSMRDLDPHKHVNERESPSRDSLHVNLGGCAVVGCVHSS